MVTLKYYYNNYKKGAHYKILNCTQYLIRIAFVFKDFHHHPDGLVTFPIIKLGNFKLFQNDRFLHKKKGGALTQHTRCRKNTGIDKMSFVLSEGSPLECYMGLYLATKRAAGQATSGNSYIAPWPHVAFSETLHF